MGKLTRGDFSPEVRERVMRLVREQRDQRPSPWAAISAIAPRSGVGQGQKLIYG